MDFEEWWAKQTANFDPEKIGLMQLARITWNAAQDVEREACAKVCGLGADMLEAMNENEGSRAALSCAASIRMRSNVGGNRLDD